MATPKDMLKIVVKAKKENEEYDAAKSGDSSGIKELIARVFTTRNLAHFAHWKTNSYAAHMATGDLYDEIVELIDGIVEVYQGKFGLIQGASTNAASVPECLCKHVEQEAQWVAANKERIANKCSAIENELDTLEAAYLKVIYKLKNLK